MTPKNEINILEVKFEVVTRVKMKLCVFCCDIVYSGRNVC